MFLFQNIKRQAAGAILALAVLSSLSAKNFVSSDSLRWHMLSDGVSAELTYLAYDTTNVTAYSGDLNVPANVTFGGAEYQVTGVTPFACVYCDGLKSVTLPEGLTRIGFGAFSDCPALTTVSLPSSLSSIGDWCFYRDSSLQVMAVPQDVNRVGACTFAFCTALDSISLNHGLRSIAQNSFYYCNSLARITIPRSVDQIGEYAFAYCTSLQEIRMVDEPVAITEDVFEGIDVTTIRLVVPTDQVAAYQAADVWQNFNIVDGGYDDLAEVPADEFAANYFSYRVVGNSLYLNVNGDAPALVYDSVGRRIAVAPSHSGETHVNLMSASTYILKCGKQTVKILLP